jgi:hypothetical protein
MNEGRESGNRIVRHNLKCGGEKQRYIFNYEDFQLRLITFKNSVHTSK